MSFEISVNSSINEDFNLTLYAELDRPPLSQYDDQYLYLNYKT
jgi:hypothetical protein